MIPFPQESKVIEKKGNKAVFEIEGLYPGYGVTIGNSLRRVLLSSLEGAAIARIKIRGVQHEFSTLPGVLEDILHLTMNIKQIRCKMYTDEPQKIELSAKGQRKVTAGDLKVPSQVEIVNTNAHIATLTSKGASLDMEFVVERGLGYVAAERRGKEKLEIGTIMLDAIFTPIRRVAFRVENMRVGDRTDFDRLFIELETDGTISPEYALGKTITILTEQYSHIAVSFPVEEVVSQQEKKKESRKKEIVKVRGAHVKKKADSAVKKKSKKL